MKNKDDRPEHPPPLRQQAEKIAREKVAQPSEDLESLSPEETRQMLHELRVHRIELETQNEALRRAQAELEATRARYFDLYDLAPMGYVTLSEQGKILEANLTATQMLGVNRGALVKQPISRFIIPEDQDIYYLNRQKLLETGQPQGCELRILRANADPFWARIEAAAGQDVDGPSMYRITISDIADRKQAERHQHLAAEILGLLNTPSDLTDTISRILTAIKRETGFEAVGIRLRNGDDFPFFVQEGFSNEFLLAENTLVAPDSDGEPCRDKDGNYSLESTCGLVISGQTDPANPLFTPGGSAWTNNSSTLLDLPPDRDPRLHPRNRCPPEGFLSVALIPIRENQEIIGLLQLNAREKDRFTLEVIHFFEGISASIGVALKRKQTEEALKKANKVTANILESISDAFFSLDDNLAVTFFNPTAERLLGRKSDEVLGRNLFDAFPEARGSIFEDRYRQALKTKRFISFEAYFDREPYRNWYEVRAYPQENGISVFFQVTTERKRAEEKIKALLKEKELLLREVHHRIKNNMLTMMTLLTLQSKTLKDPQAVAALGDAKSRLQSMSVLYDKLYRTENLQEMSIRDYLPALVEEIIGVFPNKASVKIETRIEDFMLGAEIFSPLGIVINELLTNAMKCAFIGREDGLIRVSAAAKDHRATIVIEDNGIGLPESIDFKTSSGFGLQLVAMLTKQIGGTLRIERRKGTRFVLEFEVYRVEDEGSKGKF
jgi:PAS domain S-box-containing protein